MLHLRGRVRSCLYITRMPLHCGYFPRVLVLLVKLDYHNPGYISLETDNWVLCCTKSLARPWGRPTLVTMLNVLLYPTF